MTCDFGGKDGVGEGVGCGVAAGVGAATGALARLPDWAKAVVAKMRMRIKAAFNGRYPRI